MACETMAHESFDCAVGRLLANDRAWEMRRRENMAGKVGPLPSIHVSRLRKRLPTGSIATFDDGYCLRLPAEALDGKKEVVGPFIVCQGNQRLPLGLGTQLDPQTGEIFRDDGRRVRAAAHVTLVLQWLGRARGRLVMVEAFGEQHERNLVQCVNSARQLLPKNAIEYMDGGYRLSLPAEVLDGDARTVAPFTVWPEQRAVLVAPRGMSEVPAYLTDREYLIFDSLLGSRGRPVRKAAIEAASRTTVNRIRYSYNTLRCKLGPEMFIETPGCYQLK
jgi:hypothetical protein